MLNPQQLQRVRVDVEDAARFLRFAFAADTIDPLPGCTAIGAFGLERSNKEFRDLAVTFRAAFIGIGRQTTLQPGEQFRFPATGAGLQIGHNDDFELQPLRFVNGHQLHAIIALGSRIGLCGELVERRTERGTEEIGLSLRQAVEAPPKQIEIGARRGVDTLRAARMQPDLLEPGSGRGSGLPRAQVLREFNRLQHTLGGELAFVTQKLLALSQEFGHGAREQRGIVCADERVQIGKRETAPRRAQDAPGSSRTY